MLLLLLFHVRWKQRVLGLPPVLSALLLKPGIHVLTVIAANLVLLLYRMLLVNGLILGKCYVNIG